jgi:hypothetical protein
MAVTRLSGGLTPANGSDPRTFPAIWNATADDIEAAEAAIAVIEANDWVTTARIDDGAVTAPKLATTAGAVMTFADATARTTAIPTPVEGMVSYLEDVDRWEGYTTAWGPIGGRILQVVSTAKTDTFSTSSSTFSAITGLTATITPSSTASKILIIAQVSAGGNTSNDAQHFRLSGGNSGNFVGDASGSIVRALGHVYTSPTSFNAQLQASTWTFTYLDSPATTSPVTYGVETRRGAAGTVFVNRTGLDNDANLMPRTASSITVMEVAG